MLIYYLFFGAITLICIIVLGLNLSSNIQSTIVYFLFWMLYILTVLTIINVILTIYYYIVMRNKKGPPGVRGPQGDPGEIGKPGKCAIDCRDSLCYNQILNAVSIYIKSLDTEKEIKFNNVYLKQKIKSICSSPEYRDFAPYKGADELNKYLIEIWKKWIQLIFDAGGRKYFESIGAEMEWEWTSYNPFDEIKKYDVFYWGLGKEYRPIAEEQCLIQDENGEFTNLTGSILMVVSNNLSKVVDLNSEMKASIWRAKSITYKSMTYYPVGDVLIGNNRTQETINENITYDSLVLPQKIKTANKTTILVSGDYILPPIDYQLLWTNNQNCWIWRPIGPNTSDGQYISMGDIATTNKNKPPTGEAAQVRCVLQKALIRINQEPNILWNTFGSATRVNTATMLGYVINDANKVPADKSNAFNLFRCLKGNVSSIPSTDINANFYQFNNVYTDPSVKVGENSGNPEYNKKTTMIGKGQLSPYRKDSKYSILAFINLKENMTLKHLNTNYELNLILNSSFGNANSYQIKDNNLCFEAKNDSVTRKLCNSSKINQTFEIIQTGNNVNQCRIKHIPTQKFISLNQNNDLVTLSLISDINNIPNIDTTNDRTLFTIM